MKLYDVYFTPGTDMCITIAAENADQAEEIFYREHAENKSYMIDSFVNAMECWGIDITKTEYIGDEYMPNERLLVIIENLITYMHSDLDTDITFDLLENEIGLNNSEVYSLGFLENIIKDT